MQIRKFVAALIAACMFMSGMQVASAGVISTGEVLAAGDRQGQIARIHSALANEQVQSQLVALGVDPSEAAKRVAALSDAELSTIDARLADLPAGGDGVLAVIGIVALVLFILEITGVIDIFKKV